MLPLVGRANMQPERPTHVDREADGPRQVSNPTSETAPPSRSSAAERERVECVPLVLLRCLPRCLVLSLHLSLSLSLSLSLDQSIERAAPCVACVAWRAWRGVACVHVCARVPLSCAPREQYISIILLSQSQLGYIASRLAQFAASVGMPAFDTRARCAGR